MDSTRGIQNLTRRFALAEKHADMRVRIAYLNQKNLGKVRRARLTELNVEIRDVTELI